MHTRTCPNFPPFLLLLFLSFYSLFLPFFYFCLLTLTISFFAATYLHSSILPFIFNGLLILLFIHFCCYIHFFRSIFFIFQTSSSCYRRILFFPFFVIFPFFFFFSYLLPGLFSSFFFYLPESFKRFSLSNILIVFPLTALILDIVRTEPKCGRRRGLRNIARWYDRLLHESALKGTFF